jgi:hypothetical protein
MLIYVNGCSHTAENINFNTDSSPYLINSWAGVVLNKFDNKQGILINEARNGAGNDYIFHTTLEAVSKYIREGNTPSYVIIQWSGPNRRIHCNEDGELLFVNLYDHTQYYVKFEPMASLQTIHYMYSIQEFLKQHKINYFFIPYMALDESVKKTSIFNLIDMDRVVDFNMGVDVLFKGVIDHILKNSLNRDAQGHPNEFGYQEIANKVLSHISKTMIKNIL